MERIGAVQSEASLDAQERVCRDTRTLGCVSCVLIKRIRTTLSF